MAVLPVYSLSSFCCKLLPWMLLLSPPPPPNKVPRLHAPNPSFFLLSFLQRTVVLVFFFSGKLLHPERYGNDNLFSCFLTLHGSTMNFGYLIGHGTGLVAAAAATFFLSSFFLSLELFPAKLLLSRTHPHKKKKIVFNACSLSVCLSICLSLSVLLPCSTFTWIEFLASTTSLQAREQEEKEKLSLNLTQQLFINKNTSVPHYLYPSTPLTPLSFPSPNPTTYWSRRRSRISQKQKQNKHTTHTHTQTHQQTRLVPNHAQQKK